MSVHRETREPQPVASLRKEIAQSEIGDWCREALDRFWPAIQGGEIEVAGPMFCRYHTWDDGRTDCEVGFPVNAGTPDGFDASELPGGDCAVFEHVGPYDGLPAAYEALAAWIEANAAFGIGPFEVYLNDPTTTEPSDLRTMVVWPLATTS